MSSDRHSAGPSAAPETDPAGVRPTPVGRDDPERARLRGEVLLAALDRRVSGARSHGDAVASYAFATAVELDLERTACLLVREAARLHEVGKLYVRDESHPAAGYELARGAGVPEPACEWILRGGERFDRDDGPAADEPPLPSRIIAAACEYAALLDERGTESPEARRWAMIGVIARAGGALDPVVVDALARVVERASSVN
jgi:HD-GYP domain-containing protein (c-di-GMP phosphodiesterase class II)